VKKAVFLLILLLLVLSAKANAQYGGGTGDPCEPYLIADPNHLQAIGTDPNNWDKCFKLTADIDMSCFDGQNGRDAYNIIAPDTDPNLCNYLFFWYQCFQGTAFTGTFDGDGHTISNLTINLPDKDFAGLFGYVDSGGHITNLVLENANVTGRHCTGSLMGAISDGTITNCSASVTVSGLSLLGGLVGTHEYCLTENCYSTGSVTGGEDSTNLGGFTGYNDGGIITNCYSTGSVSAGNNPNYLGGFLGYDEDGNGDFLSCFWDTSVNPSLEGIGNGSDPNVIGETTENMQITSTFSDAGWDFVESGVGVADPNGIWRMCVDGVDYPRLAWSL